MGPDTDNRCRWFLCSMLLDRLPGILGIDGWIEMPPKSRLLFFKCLVEEHAHDQDSWSMPGIPGFLGLFRQNLVVDLGVEVHLLHVIVIL